MNHEPVTPETAAFEYIKNRDTNNALKEAIRSATATTMAIRVISDSLAEGSGNKRAADTMALTSMMAPLCIAIVAMAERGSSEAVVDGLAEAICRSIKKNVATMFRESENGIEDVALILKASIQDACKVAELLLNEDTPDTTH